MNLKTLLLTLGSCVIFPLATFAISAADLSAETEALYVKVSDSDPIRPALALKLADLYFDTAVEIDKKNIATDQAYKQVESYKKKALALYEQTLTGFGGTQRKPPEVKGYRILFQTGRLYTDLGISEKADQVFRSLATQNKDLKIQRESALKMAEKLEVSEKTAALKEARDLFLLAYSSSPTKGLQSYILYRLAWVEHRLGNTDKGLEYLQASLPKADPSSQQSIINDIVLFASRSTLPVVKAVALVRSLSTKYKSNQLLEDLSDAYYTADRRDEYIHTLRIVNEKNPKIDWIIAQIEFQYSEKNPSEIKSLLTNLEKAAGTLPEFSKDVKKLESEKIFYRLLVQWDGEKSQTEMYQQLFRLGALQYIVLFPKSENAEKVIDGWVASEKSDEVKLKQFLSWAEQQRTLGNGTLELKLHKWSAALATKLKQTPLIISESRKITALSKNPEDLRQYKYQMARAYYEEKKFELALPLFLELAQISPNQNTKPDQIAIFSQNLVMDIYALNNKYDAIIAQSDSWTKNKNLLAVADRDPSLQKELNDFKGVADKALFEKSSLTPSQQSLNVFTQFCSQKMFLPKSCSNAETLSVQFKNQENLILVLKAQDNKDEELLAELEFGARYKEVAEILEKKLNNTSDTKAYLKTALMYELAYDLKARDRILRQLGAHFKSRGKFENADEEAALYYTFNEAKLIDQDSFALPWSKANKFQIIRKLEDSGQGTKFTKEEMLKTCENLGPHWEQYQLEKLTPIHAKLSAIKFYGRSSQKNFQRRSDLLKKLAEDSHCLIQGASNSLRYAVMNAISLDYYQFAKEIDETPIPAEITGELLIQVKEQITEMSKPFQIQSTQWKQESEKYYSKLTADEKLFADQKFKNTNWQFAVTTDLWSAKTVESPTEKTAQSWLPLVQQVQQNPYDNGKLGSLKQYFDSIGKTQLAGYVKNRMEETR